MLTLLFSPQGLSQSSSGNSDVVVPKEFMRDGWFAFSGAEEINANTGWNLKVSPGARLIPEPTAEELANLRKVDQTGALREK